MIRVICFVSLGLFVLSTRLVFAAGSVVTLSYDDLPGFVREKNQNVTGSALLTDAAHARTGHLVRSYLPVLDAQVGAESFQTGPYSTMTQPYGGVEAKVNLFRGGKDLLEEHVRENQVRASEAGAKKSFRDELAEARRIFWRVVFNRELLKHLNAAIEQNENQLEMANRRIARGLSSETDRIEFQIHRSQLQEEVESTAHGLLLLQISLSAVLGMDSTTEFKTQDSVPHVHDEAFLALKVDPSSHPDVETLRADQNIFSFQKSLANRWWAPSLDVYGGYFLYTLRERDYLSQNLRYDGVMGVRLNFELFDGLASRSNAAALAFRADGLEEQTQQRTRYVDAQIQVSKEDLKHDHELIHFSEERIEQGKKYLARTLDEYNRGVKNSIDLLGAAQRYIMFQRQYAERRRDYQITKSGLLALLGQ